MSDTAAPPIDPQTFSADPNKAILYAAGAFAMTAWGLSYACFTFKHHDYDLGVIAVVSLAAAFALGRQAMRRMGHFNIHEGHIEWNGPCLRKVVVFDGTEEFIPLNGGLEIRQGATRIPLYRKHPRFARIEALLTNRSQVFHRLMNPAVPLTVTANPDSPPSPVLNYLWAYLLFTNIDNLLTGDQFDLSFIIVLLFFFSFGLMLRLTSFMAAQVTFEPTRIVIKKRKSEQFIPAREVKSNIGWNGALCISALTGKPQVCIAQANTIIPLNRLHGLIIRTYYAGSAVQERQV
jgi:hypothetical protein